MQTPRLTGAGWGMENIARNEHMDRSTVDPRLLRANRELRRVLDAIQHPSAKALPRHVYQALERRANRWSYVVERLIAND